MIGSVSSKGHKYYQEGKEGKLMLISKEAYDAIQAKNKAKIEALKERHAQEWKEGNL